MPTEEYAMVHKSKRLSKCSGERLAGPGLSKLAFFEIARETTQELLSDGHDWPLEKTGYATDFRRS